MPTTQEDTNELQQLLMHAQNASRERSKLPANGEAPVIKQDSLLDNIQWEVLPNGNYVATGYTQDNLPPGAYILSITDTGKPVFSHKKILTDTLIDLGDSNSQQVVEGIRTFWKKKDKYREFGVLYKRGILLWGPPGSGKTATVAVLINDLVRMGGIVMLVQKPVWATVALPVLRKIEPERPLIVVLEDVEEIVAAHGEHDLLALLDGEHQTDNVVNLATTNYPELLGARIINRPSRFDEVKKIGMPTDQMRETYLKHVLKETASKYNITEWVTDTKGMSIAHLKELVVAVTCLDQPYSEVIERLQGMKTVPRSSVYDGGVGFTNQPLKAMGVTGARSAR